MCEHKQVQPRHLSPHTASHVRTSRVSCLSSSFVRCAACSDAARTQQQGEHEVEAHLNVKRSSEVAAAVAVSAVTVSAVAAAAAAANCTHPMQELRQVRHAGAQLGIRQGAQGHADNEGETSTNTSLLCVLARWAAVVCTQGRGCNSMAVRLQQGDAQVGQEAGQAVGEGCGRYRQRRVREQRRGEKRMQRRRVPLAHCIQRRCPCSLGNAREQVEGCYAPCRLRVTIIRCLQRCSASSKGG